MVYVQEILAAMKTCVVIPAHNEEATIGELVQKIKSVSSLEVVVIDDGSTDATSGCARHGGAAVLRNPSNRGKGASLVQGFDYCLNNGIEAVITMDADGQHLAEDIPAFLRCAGSSEAGIFIGNRMSETGSMPWLRFLTNKLMSGLISAITGQRIPDSQCGFRMIKRKVLEKVELKTRRYETESELLIKACAYGFGVESVPIKTVYNQERSHINPLIDSLRFIRFICGYLWNSNH